MAALESKYAELHQPLYYGQRCGMANRDEGESAGVPGFWLQAMKNNAVLAKEITEWDEGALKYLKDIQCLRGLDWFKLEFWFDAESNPYFKNSVLTRTQYVIDGDEGQRHVGEAIGTEIEWYPGKCLTQIEEKKSADGDDDNANAIVVAETEYCPSFFYFFDPPQSPYEGFNDDDESYFDMFEMVKLDYKIARTIRDKIIPRAVSWYTGEEFRRRPRWWVSHK